MLKLILGKNWTANRAEVLDRISQDVHSRRDGRVLIVPELISHEMERRLCQAAGDTASRYAEVLSFSRMARRVLDAAGSAGQECLDAGGRIVAMAAAARQMSSKLKAYAAVETKPEFLAGLIDGVDEFKRCCISSDDLLRAAEETDGSLAQKLEELSVLMEGYDALCQRGKRDPRDQMTWLLERLEECDYAREHVFYIDGFPDFTRQNMAIIAHLIRESPQVTISLNCDKPDSPLLAFEKAGDTASQLIRCAIRCGMEYQIEVVNAGEDPLSVVRNSIFQGPVTCGSAAGRLQVYRADSPWQECMAAANAVRDLVSQGCRYRDITLVCCDMGHYLPLIRMIFNRFQIPVYQSGMEEILSKNVISTVLAALDAALSGFDQKDVLRYLRSSLSPLSQDAYDLMENYAVVWGIRGKDWLKTWEFNPDGLSTQWTDAARDTLTRLNNHRVLALEPLSLFRKQFLEASNLRQQVLSVYAFLEAIRLEERLARMADEMDAQGDNRSAQILNQLWEILLGALEQMHDVLGDSVWDPEHFTRLLKLLLSQYEVGTIPPVLDAVQAGPVASMRCHEEKHLIVLGAQEGNFPSYTGSKGVLTDQERVLLRQMGVPLTGGAMEGIQAEFADIYGVFCGAKESIRVFASGEQPSFLYRRLADLAGGVLQADEGQGFAGVNAEEAGAWLARWDAEDAARSVRAMESYLATREKSQYSLGKVTSENIQALYGKTLNLSASQIDRQAECRLSYFLKYGLRAQERKEATIDPAEFGTYVHAVLENTCRCIRDMGGFAKVSLEETQSIAREFSDAYAKQYFDQITSDRVQYLFRRNTHELAIIVEELWDELRNSGFAPVDFEVCFGSPDDLPPIAIPNGAMNAILRGFVDRVDVWNNGATDYYRVVDYKTGRKDFDYCDVFNGVGLQMLLYMFALKNSGADMLGSNPVAAGVQYFPARVPYLTTDGKLSEEDLEKNRQSSWKRKGLLLQDSAVLRAMEPEDPPRRMSYTVRKDGSLSGDLADRDQLKLLEGYVFRILAKLVEDIASGNVEPNPYTRGSSHSACDYCPYATVCHKECVTGRRNYKTMTAQRFWEEVGKEMG